MKPIDRTNWGPGPWDNEPDQVAWTTGVGYPGLINRGDITGALNGYVCVPKGHPFFGKRYGQIEGQLEVHDGVTFAAGFAPGREVRPDEWWIGFSGGGTWGHKPAMKMSRGLIPDEVYRDLAYITLQTELLARQLKAVADRHTEVKRSLS